MTTIVLAQSPNSAGELAKRIGMFAFGLVAYAMFLAAILYAIGFVTDLAVPRTIDGALDDPIAPVGAALLINTGLLTLFVVQHTIMARRTFKRRWTRIVSPAIERSIFVAIASAILILLFWQWRTMSGDIWDVSDIPFARIALTAIGMCGWLIVLVSSFMVSHFDLFGLRQVWFKLLDKPARPIEFRLVGFYKLVRHPLMVGFLIAFWCTPLMTVGHLFFASMTTLYIVFGTWLEERDLVDQFGDTYRQYQERVHGFIPLPRRQIGPWVDDRGQERHFRDYSAFKN